MVIVVFFFHVFFVISQELAKLAKVKQEEREDDEVRGGGARREVDENEDGIDPAVLKDIVVKLKAGCSERHLYVGLGKVCACRYRVLRLWVERWVGLGEVVKPRSVDGNER